MSASYDLPDAQASNRSLHTLRSHLKAETRERHEQLEAQLDLLRPNITIEEYGILIRHFERFHSAFESYVAQCAAMAWAPALFYRDGRTKAHWLHDDLQTLVLAVPKTDKGLHDALRENLATPSALWGAIYVIEGSTLGGVHLERHFRRTLGLDSPCGLRYFCGYGGSTGRNWHGLLNALEDLDSHPDMVSSVIAGAKYTFDCLAACFAAQFGASK